MGLTAIDIIVLLVLGGAAVMGFLRGFVSEVLSLLAYVLIIFAVRLFHTPLTEVLTDMGVYPFVVPFVPISGTPLESHPAPTPAFMHSVLPPLAQMIRENGMSAGDIKAGCGRCGACSALSAFEKFAPKERAIA